MAVRTPHEATHEAKAHRVLERFVRDYVVTFLARRSRQNLLRLENAFQNASAHRRFHHQQEEDGGPPRGPSRISPEDLGERRRQLERKYSSSCLRPPSPSYNFDPEEVIIPKSSHKNVPVSREEALQLSESDDSDDAGHSHQYVTFEVAIQHLHAQLVQSRGEIAAKDGHIRKLEALVASLEIENKRLHCALQGSLKTAPTPHTLESNQVFTT